MEICRVTRNLSAAHATEQEPKIEQNNNYYYEQYYYFLAL